MVETRVFYDKTRRFDLGRWVVKLETFDYAGISHSLQMAFPRKPSKAEREAAITLLEDRLQLSVSIANEKLQRS